jgi:tartrate-resistant acid phosphatase type 5
MKISTKGVVLTGTGLIVALSVVVAASKVPRTTEPLIDARPATFIDSDAVMCILGDTGTGLPLQYAIAVAMRDQGCTDVRIVGDLIYPSGIKNPEDPLLQSKFFEPYRILFDKGITFSLVLGNHDYKGNEDAWFEVAKASPHLRMPFYNYAEHHADGICIFTIDTTWTDKLYFLNRRVALNAWLEESMEALSDQCRFSLALGHHPLKSSGRHEDATVLVGSFLNGNVVGRVDAYIAGHEHNLSDEGVHDGTHLLVSGGGGWHTGANSTSPYTRFAMDAGGFMTLKFRTVANAGEQGRIQAEYTFHAVKPGAEGEAPLVEPVWSGVIDGAGLR